MNKAENADTVFIDLKVIGGEQPAASTVAQKLGPLGIPPAAVREDIRVATEEFKGYKVNVRVAVKNRKATIEVRPSTSTLILKALCEEPRDRKKVKNVLHNGSLSITDLVEIARKVKGRCYANTFEGVVKTVLGACLSVGCLVDGKSPKEITKLINEGELKFSDE